MKLVYKNSTSIRLVFYFSQKVNFVEIVSGEKTSDWCIQRSIREVGVKQGKSNVLNTNTVFKAIYKDIVFNWIKYVMHVSLGVVTQG